MSFEIPKGTPDRADETGLNSKDSSSPKLVEEAYQGRLTDKSGVGIRGDQPLANDALPDVTKPLDQATALASFEAGFVDRTRNLVEALRRMPQNDLLGTMDNVIESLRNPKKAADPLSKLAEDFNLDLIRKRFQA